MRRWGKSKTEGWGDWEVWKGELGMRKVEKKGDLERGWGAPERGRSGRLNGEVKKVELGIRRELGMRPPASPSCRLYLRAGSRRGHWGLRPGGNVESESREKSA
jgi:hypothetical protein